MIYLKYLPLHHSVSTDTNVWFSCSMRNTCFKLNLLSQNSGEIRWDCLTKSAVFPSSDPDFFVQILTVQHLCVHQTFTSVRGVCICTVWYITSCVQVISKWPEPELRLSDCSTDLSPVCMFFYAHMHGCVQLHVAMHDLHLHAPFKSVACMQLCTCTVVPST